MGELRHILKNDHFSEAHRTGNHDEERIIHSFGDDVMASTRYQCTMQLLGGWYISLFGDEYAEGKKFEYRIYEDAPGGHSFNRMDSMLARESREEIYAFLAKHLE